MPVPDFTDISFYVRQADTPGKLEAGDTFTITDEGGETFKMSIVKAVGAPWETDLRWNEDLVRLEGPNQPSEFITQISFYEQGPPFELKVFYGAVIETDPEGVGAWVADDQPPPLAGG